jgi:hypothetical protein
MFFGMAHQAWLNSSAYFNHKTTSGNITEIIPAVCGNELTQEMKGFQTAARCGWPNIVIAVISIILAALVVLLLRAILE